MDGLTLEELIDRLTQLKEKYGADVQVDMITETDLQQVEQAVGDIAYSSSCNRIKLLPADF